MFVVINKNCGKQNTGEAETGSQFSFKEAGIVHFVKDDGCS